MRQGGALGASPSGGCSGHLLPNGGGTASFCAQARLHDHGSGGLHTQSPGGVLSSDSVWKLLAVTVSEWLSKFKCVDLMPSVPAAPAAPVRRQSVASAGTCGLRNRVPVNFSRGISGPTPNWTTRSRREGRQGLRHCSAAWQGSSARNRPALPNCCPCRPGQARCPAFRPHRRQSGQMRKAPQSEA